MKLDDYFENITNYSDSDKLIINQDGIIRFVTIEQLKQILDGTFDETPEEPENPEIPEEPETPEEPIETGTADYVNSLIGRGVNGHYILSDDGEARPMWSEKYYTELKEAGFDSVRIVYLRGSIDYNITEQRLANIKTVVDSCIKAGLFPVIDYHTIPKWFDAYTPEQGEIYVNNLGAIANYFKDYAYDELVLEIANEPNAVSSDIWNGLVRDAVAKVREFDNKRVLMIPCLSWGNIKSVQSLKLPDDDMLILTIHYYEPAWITKQNCPWEGGHFDGMKYAGSKWQNIQPIVDNLEENFQDVFAFQEKYNVPVSISEWGCMIFVDADNRAEYATLLTRWFESKGFSHMVWDYDQYFGVMKNPELGIENTREFYSDYVNAIVGRELILKDYSSEVVLQDNFDSVGSWIVYQTGGGAVNISVSDNKLVANVTSSDYNYLNARVWSPKFDLEKNSIYRVSYTLSSDINKDLAHKYMGNHSWYYTYGVNTIPVSRKHTYIMPTDTQYSTRFEFLLGGSTGIVYIENFKIEKLIIN